jgi:hypothetical protein
MRNPALASISRLEGSGWGYRFATATGIFVMVFHVSNKSIFGWSLLPRWLELAIASAWLMAVVQERDCILVILLDEDLEESGQSKGDSNPSHANQMMSCEWCPSQSSSLQRLFWRPCQCTSRQISVYHLSFEETPHVIPSTFS